MSVIQPAEAQMSMKTGYWSSLKAPTKTGAGMYRVKVHVKIAFYVNLPSAMLHTLHSQPWRGSLIV